MGRRAIGCLVASLGSGPTWFKQRRMISNARLLWKELSTLIQCRKHNHFSDCSGKISQSLVQTVDLRRGRSSTSITLNATQAERDLTNLVVKLMLVALERDVFIPHGVVSIALVPFISDSIFSSSCSAPNFLWFSYANSATSSSAWAESQRLRCLFTWVSGAKT